jgi:hypothetical protein
MIYNLEWLSAAEVNLQRIWLYWQQEGAALSPAIDRLSNLRARELRAIQEAADTIELLLRQMPMSQGRAFRGDETLRVFAQGPLSVGYKVFAKERRVRIVAISYNERRN